MVEYAELDKDSLILILKQEAEAYKKYLTYSGEQDSESVFIAEKLESIKQILTALSKKMNYWDFEGIQRRLREEYEVSEEVDFPVKAQAKIMYDVNEIMTLEQSITEEAKRYRSISSSSKSSSMRDFIIRDLLDNIRKIMRQIENAAPRSESARIRNKLKDEFQIPL